LLILCLPTLNVGRCVVRAGGGPPSRGLETGCSDRHAGYWDTYESRNVRLLHHGVPDVELTQTAQRCEQARRDIQQRWLGIFAADDWSPKCDIFLYSTPREYSLHTARHPDTRAHSRLEIGAGRVWRREIHVGRREPESLDAVLAHELTHVVLADRFHSEPIPRWADEGIAIASEPSSRRARERQTLLDFQRRGHPLSLRELFSANRVPTDMTSARIFYAQSASLVEFLASRRSHRSVVQFVETARQHGHNFAVFSVLGLADVDELEVEWKDWLSRHSDRSPDAASTPGNSRTPAESTGPTGASKAGPLAGSACEQPERARSGCSPARCAISACPSGTPGSDAGTQTD
jgi:hypothetical protein